MIDMARGVHSEQIGVCIFPNGSARQVADIARLCEELDFGFVGVGDVQELWIDPYVGLTLVAEATTRIEIGPWVTNPLTRHPTVTANAIAALDDVSGGRAFLGIGVGDGAVRTLGGRPATLDQLGEAVALIRARLAQHRGRQRPGPVPIFWAAAGPRSTREGGRHGDGVIVSGWITPELLREAIQAIAEGASSAQHGGHSGVIRIFNTAIAIDDDRTRAIAAAKPYVARALARASSARVPGWSKADVDRFRRAYDYRKHFRADHELGTLVPDEMVSRKAVVGTPEECADLLRQVIEAGFERVALIPMGDAEYTLFRLARDVLPILSRDHR